MFLDPFKNKVAGRPGIVGCPATFTKFKRVGGIFLLLTSLLPILLTAMNRNGVPSQVFAIEVGGGESPAEIAEEIQKLSDPDGESLDEAIIALGDSSDSNVIPIFKALREGSLFIWNNSQGKMQAVITGDPVEQDGSERFPLFEPYGRLPIMDAQGQQVYVSEEEMEEVYVGRRMRRKINPMLDRLRLFSHDASARESAATKVGLYGDANALPLIDRALAKESDRWARFSLQEARGLIRLLDDDPSVRREAAETLGKIHAMNSVLALEERIDTDNNGDTLETDIAVKEAIVEAIQKIKAWTVWTRTVETVFSGISLSSILLIVALGLSITFGLMGVINMAHGELMMLGAYTTYIIQEIFIAYLPVGIKDFYFFFAIPLSFCVSALVGLLLEKMIIKRLYGRPLETLLATWGISLILQQGVRQIFGAANVDVASPVWFTGGARLAVGILFPYNRLFIIFLSILSVICVYLLVLRSPIGLKIRAVTQNRQMSACMGITTERVDAWTFSLGAGLAGMAGAAMTLIGNVGPDLGQNYIVDSFLVVVTGGVGKLAGTVGAAFGIGGLNKLLEPGFGAIYAKVLILLVVILFLQKRPSGLFPAKGRSIEL